MEEVTRPCPLTSIRTCWAVTDTRLSSEAICAMVDADGVVLEVQDDTRLDVHVDAITEEMCVERSGKRWSCVPLETRSSYSPIWAQDRRTMQRFLSLMQSSEAIREG